MLYSWAVWSRPCRQSRPPRFSPEARASLFQFFALSTAGVAAAYFGVWLEGRGLSAGEVGIVNAAPVLALLLINIFVGRLADRASDWRQMIVVLAVSVGRAAAGALRRVGRRRLCPGVDVFMILSGSRCRCSTRATLRLTERNGTSSATSAAGARSAWMTGYGQRRADRRLARTRCRSCRCCCFIRCAAMLSFHPAALSGHPIVCPRCPGPTLPAACAR